MTEDLVRFYREKLRQGKGVGYGNPISQRVRFDSVAGIIGLSGGEETLRGKKILDLGCGTGDFLEYLWKVSRGRWERYLGIDLVSEYVEEARRRFPIVGVEFRCERLEEVKEEFDIGVAVGTFACKYGKDVRESKDIVFGTIREFFKRCREMIVFDLMSPRCAKPKEEDLLIAAEDVYGWVLEELSERVLIDHSYAPHCYTVGVWKPKSAWRVEWERQGGW